MNDFTKNKSIETRVNHLKLQIQTGANSAKYDFLLEPVHADLIEELRELKYYPLDMLMILEKIGCMRNLGERTFPSREIFQLIDWWTPCSIERARIQDRCPYRLLDLNFKKSSKLLFFAWDCDAKCYFYDTSITPWKVVICDGLYASGHGSPESYNKVTPWESDEDHDAISIIERWIFN